MGIIVPFIRNKSFSPELIGVMSEAFGKAKAFLRDDDAAAMETLAMRIITAAAGGERDSDRLAAIALAGFCAAGAPDRVHAMSRP